MDTDLMIRPLLITAALLAAVMVVVGNLAADMAMALVDPRIRLVAGGESK